MGPVLPASHGGEKYARHASYPAVKYIRQMVTGGAFAEANKGAVNDHDFVLFKGLFTP